MLVTPAPVLPDGEGWAFEVKWDGMRILVDVSQSQVRVLSRHGRDHTDAFPELGALAALGCRATVLLDGELVCLDPETGRPGFDRLMGRVRAGLPSLASRVAPATVMAFDVLTVDAVNVCGRPWVERRDLLDNLYACAPDPAWRINTAFGDGPGLLAATAGMGLEGVVAKRTHSRYQPGRRSPHWRKVKHQTIEWFELVGYRRPRGRDVGGLVVFDDGRFVGIAFPGLAGDQRDRCAALLAEHGTDRGTGIDLPAGVAEVEVAYLERMTGGRLREPVARAVRLRGDT